MLYGINYRQIILLPKDFYIKAFSRFRDSYKTHTLAHFHKSVERLLEDNGLFSISSIKTVLYENKINFKDGFTNLLMECSHCKKNSLFLNKISGFCICHNCKKSSSWKEIGESLHKNTGVFNLKDDLNVLNGHLSWKNLEQGKFSKPSGKLTKVQQEIIRRCKCNHISVKLLQELEVKFDESNSELYVPLKNGHDIVGFKRLSAKGESSFPVTNACGIIRKRNKGSSAIVVHNFEDLTALSSHPLDYDLICLPHGQQSLPQEILPLFEEYKKLVLWFGNDSASWANVRIFAKKFSEERCSLIRPLDDQPNPSRSLEKGLDIPRIVSQAQPVSHAAIITFQHLRNDVLCELQNIDKVSGVRWRRFPELNLLLKGHRRGELTVFTGPTGCGKTTFMSEYSLDLATQGVATLWGSFEIRNERLARTMLQQFSREPLEENINMFHVWADQFQALPIYFLTFHGQQSLDVVIEAVMHAIYVHDIAHVIIDNVQFMLGLSTTESGFLDRFYRQDALIGAFRDLATKHNCHVTLVIHPRKEREGEQLTSSSIFGGAKASQEADNVLIMQTRTLSSLKLKKYLQVAKNRFSGDIGLMPLEFDKTILSFEPKKEKK